MCLIEWKSPPGSERFLPLSHNLCVWILWIRWCRQSTSLWIQRQECHRVADFSKTWITRFPVSCILCPTFFLAFFLSLTHRQKPITLSLMFPVRVNSIWLPAFLINSLAAWFLSIHSRLPVLHCCSLPFYIWSWLGKLIENMKS